MKQNRGSILIVWFLLLGALMAEDFTYRITPGKTDPYLKEPVLLRVDLNQTNPAVVLLFQFQVNPSSDYRVRPLYAQHNDALHHTRLSNLYEIYPLHTGDINVTFSLTKRVTNDAKVRYFSSGDRDDFKKLETEDFPIAIPPLRLHVRPLPKGTQLVGDFRLRYEIKTHHTQAYTPIPVTITLSGRGYPPTLTHLLPKRNDYTLFAEKPLIERFSTPQGSQIKAHYIYALTAKESFDLPAVEIRAFNPFTAHSYTLKIPKQHFEIASVEREDLVDSADAPKPLGFERRWLWQLLGYLIAFAAGVLSAILWQRVGSQRPYRAKIEPNPLLPRVEDAKDAKTLLKLLIAANDPKYTETINRLEAHLYRGEALTLKSLKAQLIKQLKETQGEI